MVSRANDGEVISKSMKSMILKVGVLSATLFSGIWAGAFFGSASETDIELSSINQATSLAQQRIEREEWLSHQVAVINTHKVGMTRAQLAEGFSPALGLSSVAQGRFYLNSCSCIKVEVKFGVTRGKDGRGVARAEDRIIEISKPYLDCQSMG
jgi:hypothetical protein